MAGMRKIQPEMTRLKELYGDDRQKMSQEMMGLYKKHKVNPMGGCLPMLLPMPIFLGLYYMLFESVELRHADWLWIADLSVKRPLLCVAADHGRNHVVPAKTQSTTSGSQHGHRHEDNAHHVHFYVYVVPGRAGTVLDRKQRILHSAELCGE